MLPRQPLFQLLLLLNIAAVFTGLWYYWDQLSATPLLLAIFVPDCPLYVLLFVLVMAGIVKSDAFSFLASVGMAKYGLWTVFVLLFHWGAYSLPTILPITIIFIIGHTGMALEGMAILPKKKVGLLVLALALAWFLLNDYADYFLGTRPPIPADGIELVRNLTIAASLILTLGFCFYAEKVRSWPPVRLFRWIIGPQA